MKTRLDVITEALRKIEVTAVHEEPDADHYKRCVTVLESLYDEHKEINGGGVDWDLDTIPDELLDPFACWLAGTVSTGFSKPQYVGLATWGHRRVRARDFKAVPEDPIETGDYF
jgi:hypothetical protein